MTGNVGIFLTTQQGTTGRVPIAGLTLRFASMLARRIIAVSPDKGFGKQLAMALRVAGGTVDVHHALDSLGHGDLQAALCVLHCDGELTGAARSVLPRLTGDCKAIVVLPRLLLSVVVEIMQSSDRVAGVMVAEDFDGRTLSAMAMRALTGDVFGLEKLVMWGVQVHSQLVGDFHEKSLCMSQISEFAELVGLPRRSRESIEQCLDEMLMNALYDAPVDEQGKPIFVDIPTKTRISLRTEQVVVVQYAYDGRQFAVSVRDAFGSLTRPTVLSVLHKCLHAEQPVDQRIGGAGVGLYLMASSSTAVYFHVAPGVATEVVCTFDLEVPQPRLEQFGFLFEQIEVTERLAASASRAAGAQPVELRRPIAPARAHGLMVASLYLAIAFALVLIGIAAWPRFFGDATRAQIVFTTIPRGATIEVDGRQVGIATTGTLAVDDLEIGHSYAVVARLDGYQPRQVVMQPRDGENQLTLELQPRAPVIEVDSEPTGATIEVGGKPMGRTPLALTSFPPGTQATIVFKRTGSQDATARLKVPGPGERTQLVQQLEISDEMVHVRFVSDPPGAQVIRTDQPTPTADRTYTPVEVLVEANKVQRFMLIMAHHVPLVIPPFTPARGDGVLEKGGTLVEGASLRIEAAAGGKVTVSGAPHCTNLGLPADCTLAPGSYAIEYVDPNQVKATRTVKVVNQDVTVKL
jgi:hypothetical protein